MAKQIIWSNLAQSNRKLILDYWKKRNKSNVYSKLLNLLFEDAIELISKYPKIGKKTEVSEIRIKIVKDFFLTYRETESTIEILTIWDTRQDQVGFKRIIKE